MLEFDELSIASDPQPAASAATLRILAAGEQPLGNVKSEDCPPDSLDHRGWFWWLLGHGTPRSVWRSVVRDLHGSPVLALQFLNPVFQEVVRVYGPDGAIVGRLLSHWKTTLRGGFRVALPDRQPWGEVPFIGPGERDHPLLRAGSGREIGRIVCHGGEPRPSGRATRYTLRTSANAADDPQLGRLFLLASAVTLAAISSADDQTSHAKKIF